MKRNTVRGQIINHQQIEGKTEFGVQKEQMNVSLKSKGGIKEQQDQLQAMFQTFTSKMMISFKSRKVQLPENRNVYKEALVWYVKIAINEWHNLGAEVMIPKWDPIKHKTHSME